MLDKTTVSLCPTLKQVVLLIGEEIDYTVGEDAPDTYHELIDHLDSGKKLVVYWGGCDNTMFSTPEANHAFRAWHDMTHYKHRYDFSVSEEMFVCWAQIQDVLDKFGPEVAAECSPYLIADLIGQRVYYEHYKKYVVDLRGFVLAYIKSSKEALSSEW